jgi:hypothetical protein
MEFKIDALHYYKGHANHVAKLVRRQLQAYLHETIDQAARQIAAGELPDADPNAVIQEGLKQFFIQSAMTLQGQDDALNGALDILNENGDE